MIHTDLERGFIRAEVIPYDDLVAAGSMDAAKHQGKVRVEGKDTRSARATSSTSASPSGLGSASLQLLAAYRQLSLGDRRPGTR